MDDEAASAIADVFASFSESFTFFREDVSQQLATQNRNVERQLATLSDEFGRKLNFHTTLICLGMGSSPSSSSQRQSSAAGRARCHRPIT